METSKFQHKHMEIQGKNHHNYKVFSMTEYTINKVNLDGLSIQGMKVYINVIRMLLCLNSVIYIYIHTYSIETK